MAMRLFLSNETDFSTNGHKYIESIFTHEIRNNSEWYLDVRVPLEFIEFIEQDNIVVVKTKEKGKQPFRIKDITVGSDIRFEAWHIGFDAKVYTVSLSTVINLNCQNAINEILGDTQANNFTSFSDISGLQSFSIINMTLYEALIDIASRYNGVLEFDGWQIRIASSIGSDKGVTIAYGKNLESAEVEERWDMVCTELQPLGNNGLVGTTVFSSIQYDRPYAKIVSFDTDDLTTLNNLASAYVSRFENPQMYYKVSANVDGGLGDTIQVKARQFTVFTQVLGYKFNIKTQQMIEIEFGNFRPTIRNAIGQLRAEVVEQSRNITQLKIDEVNGEISAIASDVGNLEGQVSSNTAQLVIQANQIATKVEQSTFDTLSGRVSTAETSISQHSDAIALRATKTEVTQAIDDIQIGGVNTFSHYSTPPVHINHVLWFLRNEDELFYGFAVTGDVGTSTVRLFNVIKENGEWTVSWEVRGNQSSVIPLSVDICDLGSTNFLTTADNTWKRFSLTVNVTNYSSSLYNFVDFNVGHANYLFRNIKVEKGNKATDWTPAPEDVDSKINGIETRVSEAEQKITPTAITSTVRSSTEYTNDLGAKVSTNEVISRINQTAEVIKIQADKISLEGLVTVNTRFKILADGSMEATNGIFSGNITAQTGSIGRFDISGDDLVYTSDLFEKDYDWSDYTKLQRLVLELDTPTAYDYAVYNFHEPEVNRFSIADIVLLQRYLLGIDPKPVRLVRSVVRIGTNNGAIITQAVAQNGSLGPTTTIRGEKVTGDLLSVNGLYAKTSSLDRLDVDKFYLKEVTGGTFYETGTWTPQLVSVGGSNPSVSYSLQYGTYTKTGRLVTCHLAITAQINSAGTGVLGFTLPFVARNSNLTYQHTRIGWCDRSVNILATGVSPINNESLSVIYSGTHADINVSAGTTGSISFALMFSYTTD